MVVTLGQQYNVGEKPTVILYTNINRHAGTPNKKQNKTKNNVVHHYINRVVIRCGYTHSKSMDQPGKVANPARGRLNRENEYFPVRVRT